MVYIMCIFNFFHFFTFLAPSSTPAPVWTQGSKKSCYFASITLNFHNCTIFQLDVSYRHPDDLRLLDFFIFLHWHPAPSCPDEGTCTLLLKMTPKQSRTDFFIFSSFKLFLATFLFSRFMQNKLVFSVSKISANLLLITKPMDSCTIIF